MFDPEQGFLSWLFHRYRTTPQGERYVPFFWSYPEERTNTWGLAQSGGFSAFDKYLHQLRALGYFEVHPVECESICFREWQEIRPDGPRSHAIFTPAGREWAERRLVAALLRKEI